MNAKEIKERLTLEHIVEILEDLGAEPRQSSNLNEIWCKTVCHDGDSHKLYLYKDSKIYLDRKYKRYIDLFSSPIQ